jgi:hypothetical protein
MRIIFVFWVNSRNRGVRTFRENSLPEFAARDYYCHRPPQVGAD